MGTHGLVNELEFFLASRIRDFQRNAANAETHVGMEALIIFYSSARRYTEINCLVRYMKIYRSEAFSTSQGRSLKWYISF